jgi:hypothetical protein
MLYMQQVLVQNAACKATVCSSYDHGCASSNRAAGLRLLCVHASHAHKTACKPSLLQLDAISRPDHTQSSKQRMWCLQEKHHMQAMRMRARITLQPCSTTKCEALLLL